MEAVLETVKAVELAYGKIILPVPNVTGWLLVVLMNRVPEVVLIMEATPIEILPTPLKPRPVLVVVAMPAMPTDVPK